MSVESRGTVVYPFSNNALIMSVRALKRTTNTQSTPPIVRPGVRAATLLNRNSFTEVINVHQLSQRSTSVIRYVEVADADGHLYCVDGLINSFCWLKIVTLAKDCQSTNVILTTTERGVALKTIRYITPGEPLLMWFNEDILAMMNVPFLKPFNIQGKNGYICHVCNDHFEHPNPLKIHIALKCNRLDQSHLWTTLAKEFIPIPTTSTNIFHRNMEPFGLGLSGIKVSPPRISTITMENFESSATVTSTSTSSSHQASPTSTNEKLSPVSSNHPSPNSLTQVSPVSSARVSPIRNKAVTQRATSAFRPYMNMPAILPISHAIPNIVHHVDAIFPPPLPTHLSAYQHPQAHSHAHAHTHQHRHQHQHEFQHQHQNTHQCQHPNTHEYQHPNTHQYQHPNTHQYQHQNTHQHQHPHHIEHGVLPPAPLRGDEHAAQMEHIVSNLGKSIKGHLCIYCGKVYSRKYGLKIHIRTHTGYKPLKCKFCCRPFGDPSNLNKHVRLHSDGETPYKCDLCSKVLVRRRDLERHLKARHQNPAVGHVLDASTDATDVNLGNISVN